MARIRRHEGRTSREAEPERCASLGVVIKCLRLLLIVLLSWFAAVSSRYVNQIADYLKQSMDTSMSSNSMPDNSSYGPTVTARQIVDRTFERTYRHIVDRCNNTLVPLVQCLTEMHNEETNYPFWFETLIRDGSKANPSGLHGAWHFNTLNTRTHSLQICSIEKIASSEWKALSTFSVSRDAHPSANATGSKCVFLRDPLERFLSAFIDKCLVQLDGEDHCQPFEVFSPKEGRQERRDRRRQTKGQDMAYPFLMQELATHPAMLFEAHVHISPIRWNVHFMPLSLFCNGLFRTIQTYDFVGFMDAHFHDYLLAFGERYNALDAVTKVFNLQPTNSNDTDTNKRRARHRPNRNAKASTKIREFYTPQALRRVLEYMSFDYHPDGLGLPIPEWVDDILAQE